MIATTRGWLALPLLAVAVACSPGAEEPAAASERPDVLLVVLDTTRQDRVSAYGYPRETTPQFDLIAEAGVLFEDVTASAPWTWPSHASLFTGVPPWVHGARGAGLAPARSAFAKQTEERFQLATDRLREDLPTLAERFAEGGYRTVALVVNNWLDPELGLLRGFEETRKFEKDKDLILEVPDAIGADDGRPLFLFVNIMAAHSPYTEGPGPWALRDRAFLDPEQAPEWVRPYLVEETPRGVQLAKNPPDSETNVEVEVAAGRLAIPEPDLALVSDLYDASVHIGDYVLLRVMQPWTNAFPEGVVAVGADHGEALGEHGRIGHLASVYREVLQVPLAIAAPGRLPAGRRVATPIELRDVHDTLLELAGLPHGERSRVALARGEVADTADDSVTAAVEAVPAYARLAGSRFARDFRWHRQGSLGLVWSRDDASHAELYDLARDPGMRDDLAAREPERAAALAAAARAELARDGDVEGSALEIPEATREALRHLGYGS